MGMKRKSKQGSHPLPQRPSLQFNEHESLPSRKRSRGPKNHHQLEEKISSNLTSKILKEALNQQKEIEEEDRKKDSFSSILENVAATTEGLESDEDAFEGFSDSHSQYDGDIPEIDEEDEKILASFLSVNVGPQKTLTDVIIDRIKEKDAKVSPDIRPLPKFDSKIIELYKGVGDLLSRYTHGKLPKAFKHIPNLTPWEEILYLTEPEKWSPNALYQATRIFSSNFGVLKARRFCSLVLLPRIREDIRKHKRLHFALYQALKKSLYKPAAFHKGILLPLCESGTCSLREAVIVGSIISKVSIPPLDSSGALMKILELEYCGTNSYFIKLYLDKKYALPYKVLDALVAHFMKFLDESRLMPVIWHQSLLTFVQRYKNELSKEDKLNLDHLIRYQRHHLVTPEILREMKNSRNRGDAEDDLMIISSSVSVINKPIEEDRWDVPEVPMEED